MGVMDKFLNYMKLNDEDDEYYDEDYLDDDEEIPEPAPKKSAAAKAARATAEPAYEERSAKKTVQPKVTPIRQNVTRKMPGNGMEVCVIKPSTVEDAREITETLLANRTVVLNLEGLDVDIAQRIIDFTSGSCFAISGNLQKISHYIFIITPASVDISGDFQDIFGGSFEMPLNSGM
ncbi:MAG: cell division protein SepF [Clostridium sp.]|nr:cell division protein SepF [Acetatifactor muris]MCM1526513.1 cell division protein SepF [Bacteroides sp.]MCM1562361.1 cell division protein SepF [Clostridium sp.]